MACFLRNDSTGTSEFVEIPDENLKDIQTRNFEQWPSSLSGVGGGAKNKTLEG